MLTKLDNDKTKLVNEHFNSIQTIDADRKKEILWFVCVYRTGWLISCYNSSDELLELRFKNEPH